MYGAREIELSPETPVALAALPDVKAALEIAGTEHDAELTALIAEATASIEAYCGAIFGTRDVTERHHLTEGGSAFVLAYCPAISLTSLAIEGVAQTVLDFRLNKLAGCVRRVDNRCFGTGEHAITYSAGYASIPAAVSRAALELVRDLYNAKGANDDVARESVPDVGTVEYRSARERTLCANGVELPSRVALMLSPYKVNWLC